jgi:hypothetical protein
VLKQGTFDKQKVRIDNFLGQRNKVSPGQLSMMTACPMAAPPSKVTYLDMKAPCVIYEGE